MSQKQENKVIGKTQDFYYFSLKRSNSFEMYEEYLLTECQIFSFSTYFSWEICAD